MLSDPSHFQLLSCFGNILFMGAPCKRGAYVLRREGEWLSGGSGSVEAINEAIAGADLILKGFIMGQ